VEKGFVMASTVTYWSISLERAENFHEHVKPAMASQRHQYHAWYQ